MHSGVVTVGRGVGHMDQMTCKQAEARAEICQARQYVPSRGNNTDCGTEATDRLSPKLTVSLWLEPAEGEHSGERQCLGQQ